MNSHHDVRAVAMPTWERAFSSWGEEQAVVAPPTAPKEVLPALLCGPEGRLLLVLQGQSRPLRRPLPC